MAAILEESLSEAYATEAGKSAQPTLANGEYRARNPATCPTHGTHPGAAQREGETKAVKDSLGKKFDPEHPERYTFTDNISRGEKALTRALSKKEDARDAMYRKECGFIDFIWGKPGTKDKKLDRSDGFCISHIFAKHPNDIDALPEILAKGTAYKVETKNREGVVGYHGRIAFVYGNRVLFVDPTQNGKSLVVSEFRKEIKEIEEIKKNPKA